MLSLSFQSFADSKSCRLLQSVTAEEQSLEKLPLKAGQVIFLSEKHDSVEHHQNQVAILNELARRAIVSNVGMEFLSYDFQDTVDSFFNGKISEELFLKTVGWGSIPFDLYRDQFFFGKSHGGNTKAINAPRSLSRRVSQVGIDGLTEAEKKLLPPNFSLGNSAYLERFKAQMGDHVPPEAIDRYFQAQSIWDDTMAWQISKAISANPNEALVVLVGDFHVAYDGGTPYQLRKRGESNILTITQVDTDGMSESEIAELTDVHPTYGMRSDYVWLTRPGCK